MRTEGISGSAMTRTEEGVKEAAKAKGRAAVATARGGSRAASTRRRGEEKNEDARRKRRGRKAEEMKREINDLLVSSRSPFIVLDKIGAVSSRHEPGQRPRTKTRAIRGISTVPLPPTPKRNLHALAKRCCDHTQDQGPHSFHSRVGPHPDRGAVTQLSLRVF